MLNAATDVQLGHLHHVAVQLAVNLPEESSAMELLARIANINPSVNRIEGIGKVPLLSIALWRHAHKPGLQDICKRRLVTRRDDGRIALEVFAAILSGHVKLVEEIIDSLLGTEQPIDICMALTLAGFCDESAHASRVLACFEHARGYVGIAHKAANEAYQLNLWARHWYEKIRITKTPQDFWQCSILLTKIVDLRYDVWAVYTGAETSTFKAFLPTIDRAITRRVEKWQSKRKDNLFGDKCPASLFVPDDAF